MYFKTLRAVCLTVFLFLAISQVPITCYGFEITIDVAPNVINLQSRVPILTVHTDIKYNEVDCTSVALNGIPRSYCKADDRGFFVAKFRMSDFSDLELYIDEFNTLELTGQTNDEEVFEGNQDILVIDNMPVGRGR